MIGIFHKQMDFCPRHVRRTSIGILLSLIVPSIACGEIVFQEPFEATADVTPLAHTWGDVPSEIEANAVLSAVGTSESSAARLKIRFPAEVKHHLSYWTYRLAEHQSKRGERSSGLVVLLIGGVAYTQA